MNISHKRLTYICICALSFFLFAILSYLMWIGYEPAQYLNQTFYLSTIDSQLAAYATFWRVVTAFGSFAFLCALTFFTALYFFYKKDIIDTLIYTIGMSVGLILVATIKYITAIDRPNYISAVEETFSFPSGHTALSVIFLIVTGYLYASDKTRHHKKIVILLIGVVSLLIALSRLLLGEHWILDIVGGYFLGLAVASSVILIFVHYKSARLRH